MNTSEPKIVSSGGFTYRAVANWAQWPDDWTVSEVTGVATDSQDRVYVFNRGDHPVAVFDPSGTLLFSWGEGLFHRPHGIWIGPDDAVYCTDDLDHTVHKFSPDGQRLMTVSLPHEPGCRTERRLVYR